MHRSSPVPPDADARLVGPVAVGFAPVGLVIASSVRLVREGLTLSLQGRPGIAVRGVLDLSTSSLERLCDIDPDVVLMDVTASEWREAARRIRQIRPMTRLVAFAVAEVDEDVFACAAAGCCGYVPRHGGADDVHQAVLDAVAGQLRCAPHIAAALFGRVARQLAAQPEGALPPLTSREGEVLALVEAGCSNKEIARRLAISGATVKNHLHSILQKLNVTRRGQAAALYRAQRPPF